MPAVAVIIVNWNTSALLDRCLSTLYASTENLDLDVWVVDNASTDDSVASTRSKYPQVKIIENHENLGFARANNQGIRASQGEYILLLNTDAFLFKGTLAALVRKMEEHPDTGAASCKLLHEDGSLQRSCQSFPTVATELWQCLYLDKLFPESRVFGKYMMTYWRMDDFREVDVVMGACMLLRRKALDETGLFDENFFMYSEEVDLCYRLKKAGWKVRYVPEIQATHIWGGSSRQVPFETMVRLYKSRVQFFRKHYGVMAAVLLKLVLYFESVLRIAGGYLIYGVFQKRSLLQKAQSYRHLIGTVWAF